MSNETNDFSQPSEASVALFVRDGDTDKLTDALVEALYDAVRILKEEIRPETFH